MYESLEQHLETITAAHIITQQIAKLTKNNFHAVPSFSTVKLLTNVPKTNAGTNKLFSNFDKTVAEFSGTAFSFATTYPIKINENRTIIWPTAADKTLIIHIPPQLFFLPIPLLLEYP